MKYSYGRVMYNQVELSRAMVELCSVKKSEVEPW